MPLYDYRCPKCRHRFERFKAIRNLESAELCSCGVEAERVLSAPRVRGDIEGYDCPVSGKRIEGRRAHRENLARHGCRVLEAGELERAQSFRRRSEAELEQSVENTVEEAIHNMPSRERETLAAELQSGVSVDVIRL